jgi:nitroimidazol reductase NimA-like FMN-containing flavoprotein (pyridoxamine 5'-phosphate oxidase superfamily)
VSRTTVRRLPQKQVEQVQALHELLDAALVAHLAVLQDGQPFVVPTAFARDGDRLLLHGSTASRAFLALADGVPTCATVTIVDGVVVARSHFESSMHYRSAMVLGRCERLEGEPERLGLAALAARLLPGLDGARPPSGKELAATLVLSLPLAEWSLKVSDGPPDDVPADLDREVWAGVVPLQHRWGAPVPAPDLRAGIDVPVALGSWPAGRA